MKHTVLRKNGEKIISDICVADSFISRFMGLMFKKHIPDDYGLWIKPCNQIHMFNMRFSIDVIYLSSLNEVVHIDKAVKPWVVCKTVKQATSVIEVNSGISESVGITLGDMLELDWPTNHNTLWGYTTSECHSYYHPIRSRIVSIILYHKLKNRQPVVTSHLTYFDIILKFFKINFL